MCHVIVKFHRKSILRKLKIHNKINSKRVNYIHNKHVLCIINEIYIIKDHNYE